jgi:hypothetical protein
MPQYCCEPVDLLFSLFVRPGSDWTLKRWSLAFADTANMSIVSSRPADPAAARTLFHSLDSQICLGFAARCVVMSVLDEGLAPDVQYGKRDRSPERVRRGMLGC